MEKVFGEVMKSLEGAVFEAATSADQLRDVRRKGQGGWSFNPELLTLVTAAMDPKSGSVLTSVLTAGGKPLAVAAPDANTVTVTFAGPSGLGLRMLDQVAILPKHKLEAAYAKGAFAKSWTAATPPSELAGMGPFVLKEYTPGQRAE